MPISVPYRSPVLPLRKRALILMSGFFLGIFALLFSTQHPSAIEPEATSSISTSSEADTAESL